MSNIPIHLQKLRQIIRLYSLGNGIKTINDMVGISRNTINYPVIDEILRKRLDQLRPEEENIQIPSHENIRGKEYYQ